MDVRQLLAAATTMLVLAACNPDEPTANVPSRQTREAGATAITSEDDVAEFDLSDAESAGVGADGWHVTSAARGYVTGDGLAANANQAHVRLTVTVAGSDDYPSVLCFADKQMLGGYEIRFGSGTVTLIDSQDNGGFTELDDADADLTGGVSVTVSCEYFDDDSVSITVTDADENTLLAVRDASPDRREGRVAVRVSGGTTVTVFQALHFSTTAV